MIFIILFRWRNWEETEILTKIIAIKAVKEDHNIGCQENRQFVREKLAKIDEIIDHYINP
jgi:hypothetical protein